MKKVFFAIALLFCSILFAQEKETIVIRAAQMLDVQTGKMIANPVVVIKEGKIALINPKEVPSNAKSIDLKKMTLLPGLIDAHTHVTYDAGNYWLDIGRQPHSYAAAYSMVGVKNARITLQAGFTTIRDLGACCFADINLMRAIDKGLIEGPSVYPAGHIISPIGGGCDASNADPTLLKPGPEDGIGDDIDSIVEAVRWQAKFGAKWIKTCADGDTYTEAELKAMADAAHQRRLKFAVHIWEEKSVRIAVNAGADSIEHAGLTTDDIIDEMVKRGTYLVPTMYTIDTFDLEHMPAEFRAKIQKEIPMYEATFTKSIQKGVKIAFGSDSGQIPHGDNAKEFYAMVKRGMSPLQAIQSATVAAADLMSLKDRGMIAEGLRADLIAVEGNPLQDVKILEHVSFVMKGGTIYKQ